MPFPLDPSLLLQDAAVQARTAAFLAVPPLSSLPAASVCLLQGEIGISTPRCTAAPPYLASSDATTCCLVFVRSGDGRHAAAVHLDFDEASEGLYQALEGAGFFSCGAPLEVSLVGSYSGGEACEELVQAILRVLHRAPCALTLQLAAVLEANPLVPAA
jgi:hypothetical protein